MNTLTTLKYEISTALYKFQEAINSKGLLSKPIVDFINEIHDYMESVQTPLELTNRIRQMINAHLTGHWFNPFHIFSHEYLLKKYLLEVLNQEKYQLVNLLITMQQESQAEINHLRNERTALKLQIQKAYGTSHEALLSLELKMKAYQERFTMDCQRIATLTFEIDQLIEENESLQVAQEEKQVEIDQLKETQTCQQALLNALQALASEPSFPEYLSNSHISDKHKALLIKELLRPTQQAPLTPKI